MKYLIKDSSYDIKLFTQEESARWKKAAASKYLKKSEKKVFIRSHCKRRDHSHEQDLHEYMRVGPAGYVIPTTWLQHAEEIRTMALRPSDIFVFSMPRSGTTWTQELVWLIVNDLDFNTAKSTSLTDRYPFLEFYMIFRPLGQVLLKTETDPLKRKLLEYVDEPAHEVLAKTDSPRFIKSHMPLSLLPEGALDNTKMVYVARDPRDVAVSTYHFFQANKMVYVDCEFKEFFELFMDDCVIYTPYFKHIKESWEKRNHPNMLFIFYEDLSKDLKNTAERVADFFGKKYTEEQLAKLCDHLDFRNFQKNSAVDLSEMRDLNILTPYEKNFVRKGKAGAWRDHFDEELAQRAQRWIDENLEDTDLRFPQLDA